MVSRSDQICTVAVLDRTLDIDPDGDLAIPEELNMGAEPRFQIADTDGSHAAIMADVTKDRLRILQLTLMRFRERSMNLIR
jgi:hypothetical protein